MTPTRRKFVAQAAGLAGFVALPPLGQAEARAPAPLVRQRPLDEDERIFAESLANSVCPDDTLTPDGVACGLAAAMHRLLIEDYGLRPSPVLSLSRRDHYGLGARAANAAVRERLHTSLDHLDAAEMKLFLRDLRGGRVSGKGLDLESWFDSVVEPLLARATLAPELYNSYGGRVFWKAFG